MDTNQLRSWLGLPPGPWPPDDRALLGLPPGPLDATAVERKALALMGKLRSHQLVHPDLVTEGMNRLAQALIAVTSSAATVAEPVPDLDEPGVIEYRPDGGDKPPRSPVVEVLEAVPILEAAPEAPPPPARKSKRVPRKTPPPEPDAVVLPDIDIGPDPAARRQAYRELAGRRALLRAWDRLRPSFCDPSAKLASAADVFDFLEGVAAARDAVVHPGLGVEEVRRVAPLVSAVVRQQLALSVLRGLLPRQREAVARDWAAARGLFAGQIRQLRQGLQRSRPARAGFTGTAFEGFLARNPEWVLGVATLFLVLAAVVRMVARL